MMLNGLFYMLNIPSDQERKKKNAWGKKKKMVDITESLGNYLTADAVEKSKEKKLIINDEADYQKTEFGKKLTCKVQFEGTEWIWRINPKTQSFISMKYTTDTAKWVGKVIVLSVKEIRGNKTIIGIPE